MTLLRKYLNYQENRLGSWMSLYPPKDSYDLLAKTYWDMEALKGLLRFLDDDETLDSKQHLKLAFEEVKKSVLKRAMFQECYRRVKEDNLRRVEEYRKEYPNGPPRHLYVNMAIKDKEREELREILGPDASEKDMTDYWCRNPASKRFLCVYAQQEYDRICHLVAETIIAFFDDLPVIEASQHFESKRIKPAYEEWPYEKKMIVSGRKDGLKPKMIDRAVLAYQRKARKQKKYHGRTKESLASTYWRIEREAKDKGFYDLVEPEMCDTYL
jgi:hypothetical protein